MTPLYCRPVENPHELDQCRAIRHRVFVQEQRLFDRSDQDGHDASAIHVAAFSGGRIIGTVRVYQDAEGLWWGGRLAVLKRYRGRAGRELVRAAVALVKRRGARRFRATVQMENLNFFKSIGWRLIGGQFELQGRPHVLVEADLARPGLTA